MNIWKEWSAPPLDEVVMEKTSSQHHKALHDILPGIHLGFTPWRVRGKLDHMNCFHSLNDII